MSYPPSELPDPRNAQILVHVGGRLLPRDEAKVSVFDSSVQGGDAVWEGLRVYNGGVFLLQEHLDRLHASAKAMAFADVPSQGEIRRALFETLRANGMRDGVHVRLTLTRGEKITSGMSPRLNRAGACLIVLAEWKAPVYAERGLRLVTSAWRRNSPQCIDSKIHHNNLINNILAKLDAERAGADEALMLDVDGFLSETNATNVFLVKRGELHTPAADSCLPGITRGFVIGLARGHAIALHERRITLAEAYTCDEFFTTGTLGELTPVIDIDGRPIASGAVGSVTLSLRDLFRECTHKLGETIPD